MFAMANIYGLGRAWLHSFGSATLVVSLSSIELHEHKSRPSLTQPLCSLTSITYTSLRARHGNVSLVANIHRHLMGDETSNVFCSIITAASTLQASLWPSSVR